MDTEPKVDDILYYAQRLQQHLDFADGAATTEAKIIHLNLASRYAMLRELAERSARQE